MNQSTRNDELEVLPSYAVSIKHPAMQRFDRFPFSKVIFSTEISFIAGFVYGSFYAVALRHLFTSKPEQLCQNLVVVILLTVFLFVLTHLLRTLNHRRKCRASRKDKPSGDNTFFVALSYSKGKAIVDDLDWAWDQGWLTIRASVLKYDGVSTQFELPLDVIQDVRLTLTDPMKKWADQLVLVEWLTPEEGLQHIMLEPRDAKSYRYDKYRKIEVLTWLQESRNTFSDAYESDSTDLLPFPSRRSLEAFIVDGRAATISERVASYAVGAMAMLAVLFAFLAFNPHPVGFWRYLPGVVGVYIYGQTVQGLRTQLVKRRYQRKGLFAEQMKPLELS